MPSTLFINAKLWQPNGTFNNAFGVKNNRIDFAGSISNIDKSLYNNVIDLNGKLVLPGLIDGHMHMVNGSLMLKRLDAALAKDIPSLKTKISEYAEKNPGISWVIGGNLDVNTVLKNADLSNGNFVDKMYSDKPLYITNYDYHSVICNTNALETSGLLNRLGEFSDDEVVKNSSGDITGLLKEKALDYVFENLPKPGLDERVKAVSDFIDILHSYGITTITDITLVEDIDVYKKLYELGKLQIRINSYIQFEEFKNYSKLVQYTDKIDPDLYSINGFKTYWDGALGSETAFYSENYQDRTHNGYKTDIVSSGEVYNIAKEIDGAAMQMIIHAIGDKAVSEVLDLYESLYNSFNNRRHRIEHAQHIQERDFERFKKLNVIASVQPLHLKYDAKTVKEKLPKDLINKTHNYKKLFELGAVVNFGTDFPIVEVNPFENIRLAVTRKTGGEVFTPELRIDLHNCIKAYTINNAYSNFNDDAIGSLKIGKVADFVIMEDDLFEMNPDDISNAKVWKTYLNGEEVYSSL